MSSCVKEANQIPEQNEVLTETTENRGGPDCGPQGDCEETGNFSYNFDYGGCSVRVFFKVTECADGSIVYFEEEEEIVEILNGSCLVDEDFIENVYLIAIETHMQGLSATAPDCSSGGFTLESKQVKTQCQRYCIGLSPVEYNIYYWTPCVNVQSCCIETQKWCKDGEGNVIKLGSPSSVQSGECEGFFKGFCFQEPMPVNFNPCITARCN